MEGTIIGSVNLQKFVIHEELTQYQLRLGLPHFLEIQSI
jgi:hypothetical protein